MHEEKNGLAISPHCFLPKSFTYASILIIFIIVFYFDNCFFFSYTSLDEGEDVEGKTETVSFSDCRGLREPKSDGSVVRSTCWGDVFFGNAFPKNSAIFFNQRLPFDIAFLVLLTINNQLIVRVTFLCHMSLIISFSPKICLRLVFFSEDRGGCVVSWKLSAETGYILRNIITWYAVWKRYGQALEAQQIAAVARLSRAGLWVASWQGKTRAYQRPCGVLIYAIATFVYYNREA